MNGKYSLSIILPVYNEEGNVRQVISDVADFLQNQDIFAKYEIIAVDDGSRDNTATILRELIYKIPYLKLVAHYKNLGYGRASISGFKNSQYPLVFFMDADGQFKIEKIGEMLIYLNEFDIITSYRFKRKDNLYRVTLGKIYTFLVFLLFGLKLRDINCGFKLLKREILDNEKILCANGAFYTEVLLKAKNRGYRIKEVPIEHFPRLKGKATGASPKVIFNSIIDLIMLKYSLIRDRIKSHRGAKNEDKKVNFTK